LASHTAGKNTSKELIEVLKMTIDKDETKRRTRPPEEFCNSKRLRSLFSRMFQSLLDTVNGEDPAFPNYHKGPKQQGDTINGLDTMQSNKGDL
jgi:hypothetical protein